MSAVTLSIEFLLTAKFIDNCELGLLQIGKIRYKLSFTRKSKQYGRPKILFIHSRAKQIEREKIMSTYNVPTIRSSMPSIHYLQTGHVA